jgi:hypothetical protein
MILSVFLSFFYKFTLIFLRFFDDFAFLPLWLYGRFEGAWPLLVFSCFSLVLHFLYELFMGCDVDFGWNPILAYFARIVYIYICLYHAYMNDNNVVLLLLSIWICNNEMFSFHIYIQRRVTMAGKYVLININDVVNGLTLSAQIYRVYRAVGECLCVCVCVCVCVMER